MNDNLDPMPWIRAIVVAGFISANVAAAVFAASVGDLGQLDVWSVFCSIFALGLLGMLSGMTAGLSLLMIFESYRQVTAKGWVAVLASCLGSSLASLMAILFVRYLVNRIA